MTAPEVYPQGYIEDAVEARTPLKDVFSSRALLREFFDEVPEFGEDQLFHRQADGVSRLGLKS